MRMNQTLHGEATANGTVEMKFTPDASRGGSSWQHIPAFNFRHKLALVRFTGGAPTISFQGCIGDPSVAANWDEIASVTASGTTVSSDDPWPHVRFVVSGYTSGSVFIDLAMASD